MDITRLGPPRSAPNGDLVYPSVIRDGFQLVAERPWLHGAGADPNGDFGDPFDLGLEVIALEDYSHATIPGELHLLFMVDIGRFNMVMELLQATFPTGVQSDMQGTSGQVLIRKYIAIKCIPHQVLATADERTQKARANYNRQHQEMVAEAIAARSLSNYGGIPHPNIVLPLYFLEKGAIVMAGAKYLTLSHQVNAAEAKNIKLPHPALASILRDVLLALDHIHTNRKSVWLDVKSQNILLIDGGRAAITDLGGSRKLGDLVTEGTEGFMCTQQRDARNRKTTGFPRAQAAMDLFSVAIVTFEAVGEKGIRCDGLPVTEFSALAPLLELCRMPASWDLSEEKFGDGKSATDFLLACTAPTATARQLLLHPYLECADRAAVQSWLDAVDEVLPEYPSAPAGAVVEGEQAAERYLVTTTEPPVVATALPVPSICFEMSVDGPMDADAPSPRPPRRLPAAAKTMRGRALSADSSPSAKVSSESLKSGVPVGRRRSISQSLADKIKNVFGGSRVLTNKSSNSRSILGFNRSTTSTASTSAFSASASARSLPGPM
ncbi:kinase-like domain-containing protein [Blastocladiella britannica]|nr:kinase-like domain-containing protein [Blastocladiella britannica]